jgi:hypothetical protein
MDNIIIDSPYAAIITATVREILAAEALNQACETRRLVQLAYESNMKVPPIRSIEHAKKKARAQIAARVAAKVRNIYGQPTPPHIVAFNEMVATVRADHPNSTDDEVKMIARFRFKLRSHSHLITSP